MTVWYRVENMKRIKNIIRKKIFKVIILSIIITLFMVQINVEASVTGKALDYNKSNISFTLRNSKGRSIDKNGSDNIFGKLPKTGEFQQLGIATIGVIILGAGWGLIQNEKRKKE